MKMRIFLKKLQMYHQNISQPIYYTGTNPNTLQIVNGLIPDNDWIEFTEDSDNLDKLNLSWRLRENGAEAKSTSNLEKGSSDQITFVNKAYIYIKEWLNDHVSAALNGIEVRLQVDGGVFSDFIIKNDGLSYCDDDTCTIDLMLKQKDDVYTCIQTTLIADNHSGMFSGSYQHPRIAYCDEFRPSWLLTVLWSWMAIQGVVTQITYTSLYPVIWLIITIINAIIAVLRTLGFKKIKKIDKPIRPDELWDRMKEDMIMAGGCGREHPAPLVRDYISNVCSKCGVKVGAQSIPLFYDPSSDYYNMVMMSAEVKKGVKYEDATTYWIDDNKPLWTLDMFLNELKPVFNAKWYIKNNTLYFARKDFDQYNDYIFDFTGNDRSLIVEGICYTWNEEKKRAYANCGYTTDAFDNMSMDAKSRFNDIVEWNNPVNPMLEGESNKIVNSFAAARFRQDGILKDYIAESLKYIWIAAAISGGLANLLLVPLRNKMREYKYNLIIQNDTLTMPKLLIWDGESKRSAKVKWNYQFNVNMPPVNGVNNPTGINYKGIHQFDYDYDDYYNENNKLINYPLAFDANFTGNLYDRFHQIDDPRVNPPMNKNFELKIQLCTPELIRLGVFDGSSDIAIGRKVKLNAGQFYKEGTIEEIELSFDASDKLGRWIKIKGTA
ncbi:hypothetical protein [Chryseobacterium indoltheticum]|uniref:Uncharacterized protein n=1 Tax=Chryseobacterium indoltheticum TaxID=254 RepID=A0A381F3S9_9FLAO|nr:hypothetical protein [Chryseobacterium indoltheticum]AZA74779.1 hypothetical protein EG358_13845 [Chryseobacterium indoltheticum]SIQ35594.1 hypothetical protein SAMN05421682_104197 [Chryseobacterium indoltheticum]SUX41215.1 Uncharacterised protein [Chryseobacterium indoltheticum]